MGEKELLAWHFWRKGLALKGLWAAQEGLSCHVFAIPVKELKGPMTWYEHFKQSLMRRSGSCDHL